MAEEITSVTIVVKRLASVMTCAAISELYMKSVETTTARLKVVARVLLMAGH